MTSDNDAILDDLLIRWHQHDPGSLGRGFNRRAVVAGDYRISRQYDAENGSLDDELEARRMRQVDFEVSEMGEPHRTAIYCLARALTYGHAVFTSPRLPEDREERQRVVRQARDRLAARLIAAGVL